MVAHSLRGEGFDASEDGTGRGTPLVPVAFAENSRAEVRLQGGDGQVSPQLTTGGGKPGQGQPCVAFTAKDHGGDAMQDCSPTLRAGGHAGSHANAGVMPAVAFDMRGREGGAMPEGPHQTANLRAASGGSSRSYVAHPTAVRRLTPVECERLQGFPDGYTAIPWRNKPAEECPDGPRYKALGNSMAVPVMRWIFDRLHTVDEIMEAAA
jgi:site-specific DNA-cytosine methylase